MFAKIIHFSINNKIVIGFMTVVLIIWGVWNTIKLPIDAVPDITNNQVQVITQAPTLGAQEVEQFITTPIELAMANIPDVIEKRSISRSGISVITIVFKDNVDIYWARQQISEHLKEAEAQIPHGMGEPSLAPITTGLGEIYHYIIHAQKGYEDKYSATDLRTMQDWIVKRQLAGTEGLAEVSGWGGYVKQYEVALDNDKLNGMNVTIPDIYKALENNNENTGGSYIEQHSNVYFIRGLGLVKSLSDIEKIVVKNVNGIPLLIRDVATVQFGAATRYGAVTRNGEGEVVAGITLMLKGENFAQVIANVKERMTQIQKSLPEGVVIEPFIDRTELVGRAMGTVEKNLIEGGLIVVFILVLLLGNLRAGLIVASVIPLAMLFAISMMNLFGVSGNLMSLGAIDFGLIVDGAVIIVESVVHRLFMSKHHHQGIEKLTQKQMDSEVYESAGKMMSSASFGQIIILVVYLPLLSLAGIEGKMFKPMAQTVAFAILGAFLLSLTYVPVASSLFLSKKTVHKRNISDKIMDFLKKIYAPALDFALRWKKTVVAAMFTLFIGSVILFNSLGGEFIPTLEEGDLTVEISMAQGTSLSQVIETFGQAEKILKDKFPEIKQAVTRIGSAEIPTDPMPIERADMMLSMKPKEEWVSANNREEIMEQMEEALSILPGVNIEITQPMQMRFNELITGIKQDVAIKIYGEDLEVLNKNANNVAALIKKVKGVSEPIIEKVNDLPQIQVEYNRDKIAQYGLNISDINMVLKTAYAGNVAGVVFEGDKRFDMVVRLQKDLRQDFTNIENLFVPLPSGSKIPIRQVADISFKPAPAQISHEDGQRRIFVGFNVRGRDVESTVNEIQSILDSKFKLPPGYYYTYGGQFQNLKEAKERLGIAVPAALFLILLLLYFTFNSVKQSLLIFSAVPLSAIGGIIALWARGMPFSISAGVGFIALFGVAVLNGIVMIGYFNQLKNEGITDIYERVRKGTAVRLRPIIITAAVASLGFLPMALSAGAGSEVQKPLATVVIGGLISATLLTLVVLPALYIIFSSNRRIKMKPVTKTIVGLIMLLSINNVNAQQPGGKRVSIDEAISLAKNNLLYEVNNQQINKGVAQIKTATVFSKTGVFAENEDMQPSDKTGILKIGISQSLAWPGLKKAQKNLYEEQLKYYQVNNNVIEAEIKRDVRTVYYQLWYLQDKQQLFNRLDSIYKSLNSATILKVKTGDSPGLDSIAADVKMTELQALLQQIGNEIKIQQQSLMQYLNSKEFLLPVRMPLEKLAMPDLPTDSLHPVLALQSQNINIANAEIGVVKNENRPEFSGRFFSQSLWGADDPFTGFSVTAAFPLFSAGPYKNKRKVAEADMAVQQKQYDYNKQILSTRQLQMQQEVEKNRTMLLFYETSGLKQSSEIIKAASLAFRAGEISFVELSQYLRQAIEIQKNYLDNLNDYNHSVIQYNYYINK